MHMNTVAVAFHHALTVNLTVLVIDIDTDIGRHKPSALRSVCRCMYLGLLKGTRRCHGEAKNAGMFCFVLFCSVLFYDTE